MSRIWLPDLTHYFYISGGVRSDMVSALLSVKEAFRKLESMDR